MALLAPIGAHAATVTINSGDTLSTRFPGTWEHVCQLNQLANCDLIFPGQQLDDGQGSISAVTTAAPAVSRVVPTSLVLGKPYVYGAAGPNAFDCSGLTQYLAGVMGFSIPRSSYAQASSLRAITRAELLPGDLVVMNGAEHVGMYVGNGQLIHALNPAQGILIHTIEYATAYNPLYNPPYGYRAVGH
jgi:cell wall-associated NlpC family hydrolase